MSSNETHTFTSNKSELTDATPTSRESTYTVSRQSQREEATTRTSRDSEERGSDERTGVDGEPEQLRSQWGNQFQFILSALGLAVGLGNIWRFPYIAYENGGAAFLIPYLCCGIFFGLPMVYAEFMIGQFSRSGPGLALGRYAAGFRGVGWSMSLISVTVAIYYCVIISWSGVYLGWVVSGQSWKWTECGNYWNTENCVTQTQLNDCFTANASTPYYYKGNCSDEMNQMTKGAAEEFFLNYVTTRSDSIEQFGGINWPIFGSLFGFWALTTLILIKGITIMGYLSYIIVPFPYLVVCVLFGRGVTLDGALDGVKYYLLEPDFGALLKGATWAAALKQLMFSMSIGYGGLISLSSYSRPDNNFFRDALIILVGDTIMSLIGGVAAFSILGYLAKLTGKSIPEVVASGTSLAFIAYPEAIATMAAPWLWNGLFFLMLIMLGISSEIAYVEAFTGLICDCFPTTKRKKWLMTLATCAVCLLTGLLMTTHSGWYWFCLFNEFTGSTCACIVAALEVLILTFYGWKQIKQDMTAMRGEPTWAGLWAWFGPRSPIFAVFWATLCPILALVVAALTLKRDVPYMLKLDKFGSTYTYPTWAETIGWLLNLAVMLPIPAFFVYKWMHYRRDGIPFHYLFRPTKELRSHGRYYEQRAIAEPGETYSAMEEASTQSSMDSCVDYDKPAVVNRHRSLRSEKEQ